MTHEIPRLSGSPPDRPAGLVDYAIIRLCDYTIMRLCDYAM